MGEESNSVSIRKLAVTDFVRPNDCIKASPTAYALVHPESEGLKLCPPTILLRLNGSLTLPRLNTPNIFIRPRRNTKMNTLLTAVVHPKEQTIVWQNVIAAIHPIESVGVNMSLSFLFRPRFFAADGTEITPIYHDDGAIDVTPMTFHVDTRRALYNENFHDVNDYIDTYRNVTQLVHVSADTSREVVGITGCPVEIFARTRREVAHTERYTYDVKREIHVNTQAYGKALRKVMNSFRFYFDTTRTISNGIYTVVSNYADTKRVLNSSPKGSVGYVDFDEIDLGHLCDISLLLNITGTGYAVVACADEGHSFGEYETYYEHEVSCRYIRIRLYVRGYVDKAQADIVAKYYEESQDVEVPAEGVTMDFEHHFFRRPTIYVDNLPVTGNGVFGNYRVTDLTSSGLTITPVILADTTYETKLVTVKAKGV